MQSLQVAMDQSSRPAPSTGPPGLEELFRTHHATVVGAAYRITGNTTDAEDVLQTVFIRLLRRQDAAALIENAGGYLRRAAVNAALDLVRDRQTGKHVSLDAYPTDLATGAAAAPDRQQEAREMRDLIRRAIAQLAPRTAEIFALHYFEGYSNPEIAQMLGLSAAGVAVTLHRTRTRLQEEIRSFMGETS
jgi:RNA polymerase sigma-70 factor (ECF subfamily)